MAARSGMANLIKRVRKECQVGTADFTVNGVNYYSDDHIQDELDMYHVAIFRLPIQGIPEYVAGETVWKSYTVSYRNLEEAASGSGYWRVDDSSGNAVGTADYTVDYQTGMIRFSADTGGSVYYLTARSYNVFKTAAQLWREKAGFVWDGFDFSADSQRFNRSQKYEHCLRMADRYDRKGGMSAVQLMRADML